MQDDPFPHLLEKLAAIEALGESILPRKSEELEELKRQAAAAGKRRARDQRRYELGGLMFALDFEGVDHYALYGLLAHLDHFLLWAIEARSRGGAGPLATIVRRILDDEQRAARCAEWGRHLAWTRMHALYRAEVDSFIESGKAGQAARWRRDPISVAQQYLINEICKLENIEDPGIFKKGSAFDWLLDRGGNPRFLARPAPMPLKLS